MWETKGVMSKKAKKQQKYILLGGLLATGHVRRKTNICTGTPRPADAPHWVQLAHWMRLDLLNKSVMLPVRKIEDKKGFIAKSLVEHDNY